MNIQRINTYDDPRFTPEALGQHGCFLADGKPYEITILSHREAMIRGSEGAVFPEIIEEFRFYSPNITTFYDENRSIIVRFSPVKLKTISLKDIQPSQFYVDEEKLAAVRGFIKVWEDIIVQVCPWGDRYISLDGHTRLYLAVLQGWDKVQAVEAEPGDYGTYFAQEAQRRGIFTPKDMTLVSHAQYQEKWDKFCDDYFSNNP